MDRPAKSLRQQLPWVKRALTVKKNTWSIKTRLLRLAVWLSVLAQMLRSAVALSWYVQLFCSAIWLSSLAKLFGSAVWLSYLAPLGKNGTDCKKKYFLYKTLDIDKPKMISSLAQLLRSAVALSCCLPLLHLTAVLVDIQEDHSHDSQELKLIPILGDRISRRIFHWFPIDVGCSYWHKVRIYPFSY